MAMDGIGSIMSAQVQSQATQKSAAENTDVFAQDMVQKTDIDIVENTHEIGNFGNDTNSGELKQPSNEQIRKAVEALNKNLSNSEAIFGIHDATNRVIIKIVDKETREVIKELPPEKTLDMIAKVWELAGILVDEKR
ncbi:MAG TPA: flagellar protein FlaG [Lachnospiraceae bacterium]|nr:flagellar protein FlaG [Lachnospiraceae bacterium]